MSPAFGRPSSLCPLWLRGENWPPFPQYFQISENISIRRKIRPFIQKYGRKTQNISIRHKIWPSDREYIHLSNNTAVFHAKYPLFTQRTHRSPSKTSPRLQPRLDLSVSDTARKDPQIFAEVAFHVKRKKPPPQPFFTTPRCRESLQFGSRRPRQSCCARRRLGRV